MDEGLRLIDVVDVAVAVPAGNGVEAGMLVLQERGEPYRRVRMFIGQPEARAIRVAWRNEIPPRPSTWDLFVSTVSLLGGVIESVVLTDVEEGRHYFAQMLIRPGGGSVAIPVTARPSDAIALALRTPSATLQARDHVLDGMSASEAAALLGETAVPDTVPESAAEEPPPPAPPAKAPAKKAPAKKAPAKKVAAKKVAAKKVAAKKVAAAQEATPAQKAAGTGKAAPAKKAAAAARKAAPPDGRPATGR